jgi:uncharacterized membrane protein YoaT (DUF817 family)
VQLIRFAWIEATCCLFAALFFAGLGLVRVVPLPMAQGTRCCSGAWR